MMNEIRYKLSCKIQRNGLTAMSWQMRLVVASNNTEAHAAKLTQKRRSGHRTASACGITSDTTGSFSLRAMVPAMVGAMRGPLRAMGGSSRVMGVRSRAMG